MMDLAAQLESLGIERRFALDIGSTIAGVRPRGLLHVSAHQHHGLELLLNSSGLRIDGYRELYRRHDSTSREGVLNEHSLDDPAAEKWCEIWYANQDAIPIDQAILFSDPGKFLGYPECCRSAMNGEDALARLYRRYLFEDSDRHWQLNRLAALFHDTLLMPDFFPCSLSCLLARQYVCSFQSVAATVFSPNEMKRTRAVMRAPITIVAGEAIQWRDWKYENGRLRVKIASARKENLARVASYLPKSDPSTVLLVGFKHHMKPRSLCIDMPLGETMNFPLTLI
jgi:hypothetical protein